MSELKSIVKRLDALTEDLRKLEVMSSEMVPKEDSTSAFLQVAQRIRNSLTDLDLQGKGDYICHSVLNEDKGAASVQITWLDAILEDDSYSVARYCQALGNEHRLNVLKALSGQNRTTSELSEAIGLEGGPLYHHLKELINARFVVQKGRSCYQLTAAGLDALLTVCALNRRNTWEHKGEIWEVEKDED